MPILTLVDIENLINDLFALPPIYYPKTKEYYETLLTTGCRPLEPLEIKRWSQDSPATCYLIPQKQNAVRSFDSTNLPVSFLEDIFYQRNPFDGITIAQVYLQFKRQIKVAPIFNGTKTVKLYLFRYYKVKKLTSDGLTPTQISNFFKWSNSDIYYSYQNAILYTP
jgi:hypothetical protein